MSMSDPPIEIKSEEKCQRLYCDLPRKSGDYYCKLHRKESNIERYKSIGAMFAGIGLGISFVIFVIFVVTTSIQEIISDPNIPTEALDKVCQRVYGPQHYYEDIDTNNNEIICISKIIANVSDKEVRD